MRNNGATVRVGVIGDLHGHARELIAMLEHFERIGVDRLCLLGDLIDRGPDPRQCLSIARNWTFRPRRGMDRSLEIVKGNHEDAYVRIADGVPKPGRTRVSRPESRPLCRRLRPVDLDWMRGLPYYICIPELNVTCVHGGVTPYHFDLDEAGAWMLRTRYLDIDTGQPLRSTTTSSWFWAESYNGRFGTIVFGHEGHSRPTAYYCGIGSHLHPAVPSAIAIDGEGFGHLHGVILSNHEGDTPAVGFTVNYGSHKVREHPELENEPTRVHDWDRRVRSLGSG